MDGLLVVDKPVGPTSHDVVARARGALGERRIGHTGTLDPAASGVLVLVVGRATRLARFMASDTKTYDAVVRLGVSTDTYDAQGQPTGPVHEGPLPSLAVIEDTLRLFLGTTLQAPPAYSAKKIGGYRSYDLARRPRQPGAGVVAPTAVPVSVALLHVTSYSGDLIGLTVECSAGFYLRSLAHDLGERLGTGAHLAALRRTRSGEFTLADAHTLASIDHDRQAGLQALVPMSRMLTSIPAVTLTSQGLMLVAHGRDLGPDACAPSTDREQVFGLAGSHSQPIRVLAASGDLLAIATPARTGLLHPSVVLK